MKKGVMIGIFVFLGMFLSVGFVSAGLGDWFKDLFGGEDVLFSPVIIQQGSYYFNGTQGPLEDISRVREIFRGNDDKRRKYIKDPILISSDLNVGENVTVDNIQGELTYHYGIVYNYDCNTNRDLAPILGFYTYNGELVSEYKLKEFESAIPVPPNAKKLFGYVRDTHWAHYRDNRYLKHKKPPLEGCTFDLVIEREANIVCSHNSDCGTNGFDGDAYCSGNDDAVRDYVTWTCNNPGLESSSCSDTIEELSVDNCNDLVETCNGGVCGPVQVDTCIGADLSCVSDATVCTALSGIAGIGTCVADAANPYCCDVSSIPVDTCADAGFTCVSDCTDGVDHSGTYTDCTTPTDMCCEEISPVDTCADAGFTCVSDCTDGVDHSGTYTDCTTPTDMCCELNTAPTCTGADQSCMATADCATGDVLATLTCADTAEVCCDTSTPAPQTCSDLGGIICSGGLICGQATVQADDTFECCIGTCNNCAWADSNSDGDINMEDFALFSACFLDDPIEPWDVCSIFDEDDSGTIDLGDFAFFAPCYNVSTTVKCGQTDNGNDYFKRGITVNGTVDTVLSFKDSCIDATTLNESYCQGDDLLFETNNCPQGCDQGACLSTTETYCGDGIDNDGDGLIDGPAYSVATITQGDEVTKYNITLINSFLSTQGPWNHVGDSTLETPAIPPTIVTSMLEEGDKIHIEEITGSVSWSDSDSYDCDSDIHAPNFGPMIGFYESYVALPGESPLLEVSLADGALSVEVPVNAKSAYIYLKEDDSLQVDYLDNLNTDVDLLCTVTLKLEKSVTTSTSQLVFPNCSDGIDNDGDGLIDALSADPDIECLSAMDISEEAHDPDCDNCIRIDSDGDGVVEIDTCGNCELMDIDGDGSVDTEDIEIYQECIDPENDNPSPDCLKFDINNDGFTNVLDYPFIATCSDQLPACIDSDDGDLELKGDAVKCYLSNSIPICIYVGEDLCINDDLTEIGCGNEKIADVDATSFLQLLDTTTITCDYGCGIGACLPEDPDSDCSGCMLEDNCYVIGAREGDDYCLATGDFVPQLADDETCENNYECESNVCLGDKCVSQSFLQSLLDLLRDLLGLN
jgi:hypothetical protein